MKPNAFGRFLFQGEQMHWMALQITRLMPRADITNQLPPSFLLSLKIPRLPLCSAAGSHCQSIENHMHYCPTALFAVPALNYTIRGGSPPSFCPNMAIRYNPLPSAMHNSSNSWLKEGAHAHYGKDPDLGKEGVCMCDGTSPCNTDSFDTSPSPPRWESLL